MGRIGLIYSLASHEETLAFGQKMAKELPKNAILALTGDLGAGKTTFVQGLAMGLGIAEPITSPTFVLMNHYEGLTHFDLYRLNEGDFAKLGFEEYFHRGLCAIEWPGQIANILPQETIHIHFSYDANGRTAEIKK